MNEACDVFKNCSCRPDYAPTTNEMLGCYTVFTINDDELCDDQ